MHSRAVPLEFGEHILDSCWAALGIRANAVERRDDAGFVLFCQKAAQQRHAIYARASRERELVGAGVVQNFVGILLRDSSVRAVKRRIVMPVAMPRISSVDRPASSVFRSAANEDTAQLEALGLVGRLKVDGAKDLYLLQN